MKRLLLLMILQAVTPSPKSSPYPLGQRKESLRDCIAIQITGKGLSGAFDTDSIQLAQVEELTCYVKSNGNR